MPIYRLDPDDPELFPPYHLAAVHGPAAVGGDLSPLRLISAYRQGYFPWYGQRPPILWWNPDPRFVLFPAELKVSKSMRPYFNQEKYHVTFDRQFEEVIRQCRRVPRRGQDGTWINDDIEAAYGELHRLGLAHSVEVYDREDRLVGGLYGLALGRVFFGESMFATARDASKFGFISLVRRLKDHHYRIIDCQQETAHLSSLGGRPIDRIRFQAMLDEIDEEETELGPWENPAS